MGTNSRIIDFSGIDNIDADSMGKIAHKLGELKHLNIPTPDGFVIMPSLFRDFLEETGIFKNIKKIQSVNHPAIENSMSKLFEPIQKKIMNTRLPSNITKELNSYYRKLSGIFKEQSLNIFTSPLRGKSLRFFDIKGDANMILTIKKISAANP